MFTLYQKARDLIKSKQSGKYVDLNYWLKVQFENNKESFFPSINELLDLTNQENNSGVLRNGAEGTNVGENL